MGDEEKPKKVDDGENKDEKKLPADHQPLRRKSSLSIELPSGGGGGGGGRRAFELMGQETECDASDNELVEDDGAAIGLSSFARKRNALRRRRLQRDLLKIVNARFL